jgi:anti-anti-sigma factor
MPVTSHVRSNGGLRGASSGPLFGRVQEELASVRDHDPERELTTPSRIPIRSHWVVPELDARGEVDAHTAMCLLYTIEGVPHGAEEIVVDLRDLTSIDAASLTMFVQAHAQCRARGTELGLLISGRPRHDEIANAFASAGLADQPQFICEPLAPPPAPDPRPAQRSRMRAVAMRMRELPSDAG